MTTTETDVIASGAERSTVPFVAGEREMLEAWLGFHRGTLMLKCSGLTGAQLKQTVCPPSNLSLLGLVRHMALVERWWFRRQAAAEPVGNLYISQENPGADFEEVPAADAGSDVARYREEVRLARQAAAGLPLDHTFPHPTSGNDMTLRWVFMHMIEEYARHNGHADLLRERIDGATGR
jgi:hypothetical protein